MEIQDREMVLQLQVHDHNLLRSFNHSYSLQSAFQQTDALFGQWSFNEMVFEKMNGGK
jgi:hypothetical protein